jgi:hypothetical protein
MAVEKPPHEIAADLVADALDADVLFINNPINRFLDELVRGLVSRRRRRKNVVLVLVTTGGDADAGYRIARCLGSSYDQFVLFVTGYCKSAGTLIAIGADELVVADGGELGPLDVQMSKPDELIQRQSGLTATAALTTLHEQAFKAFEHFFVTLLQNGGDSISTRTATQIAVQLTSGLFAPMYGHVDPMHVGEAGRALLIAQQYGQLLDATAQNLEPGSLAKLTSGFASHSFVIDRPQLESFFKRVREPDANERLLAHTLGRSGQLPAPAGEKPFAVYLSSQPTPAIEQDLPLEDDRANTKDTQRADAGAAEQPGHPKGQPGAAAEAHAADIQTVV